MSWFLCSAGILLQEEKINSVFLLYLMAIPSFCILTVAALALENWSLLEWPRHYDGHLWLFIVLSCLGSVLYNLASSSVIALTSAVTLHILGNLSVVGNLLLSQLLFGSELTALSYAGVALTLSGMLIYQNSEFLGDYMDARSAAKATARARAGGRCEDTDGDGGEGEGYRGEAERDRGAEEKEEEEDGASSGVSGLTAANHNTERLSLRTERDKMD